MLDRGCYSKETKGSKTDQINFRRQVYSAKKESGTRGQGHGQTAGDRMEKERGEGLVFKSNQYEPLNKVE